MRPFVKLVNVMGEVAPSFRPGVPPLAEVQEALKPVIARPLLLFGLNDTVIDALPDVAARRVGAAGTVAGTTAGEGSDGVLGPFALTAETVHVYVLAFVRPMTVIGDAEPLCAAGAPPLAELHAAE